MKFIRSTSFFFILAIGFSFAQESVIPKAKTKAERKAARKKMTLEERIEDTIPVDINLPTASAKLPGSEKISNVEDAKKYINETLPGYGAKAKKKIKKTKKQIAEAKAMVFDGKKFEGLPVEKQIYRRGSGSRMTYIEFYTLDGNQEPSPYHRILTWYDLKRKRIAEAVARDRKTNLLMHGPYKEYRGDFLVQEGEYYMGEKHGRWVSYDKDFILLEKEVYNKGHYADSDITYFDADSVKIKEVLPKIFGEETGQYLLYHENGTLAMEGMMDGGFKVGKWVEYYDGGNRRKKEIQYRKDRYDEAEPLVVREYSEDGKMIFEHESVKRN
ncbi:hypothetical protein SAMN06298216_1910 [Spirosomataceae bacterium TFI 002]|nr:hypothetical protein SAMN06298216_1910 [Spirosomataceae bacterium TFI 002]